MKLCFFWLSLLIAGALFANAFQPTEESSPAVEKTSKAEFSFAAASLNKYVWRGLALTNAPVLQPAVTLGMRNFIFNTWANLDLGDVNDRQSEFNEVDYTLEYGFKLRNLSLSLGAIHYTFPTTVFNSTTDGFTMESGKNSRAEFNFGLNAPFSFMKKYSITPSVGYSGLLGGSMRNSRVAKDHFLAGVTFSGNF